MISSGYRKPLIAANWKMHNTLKESVDLVTAIKKDLNANTEAEVLVAPSYTSLSAVKDIIGNDFFLAAQDCHYEEKGAFTSAVSPTQIKDVGCTHVIIGHSERRQLFGDTDNVINKKIKAAMDFGLLPILCVGEMLNERESGKTFDVVETQIKSALSGFSKEQLQGLIIAYEPVWAIGTGKTATPEQAQEVHVFIRHLIKKLYDENFAGQIRIIYGGSVNESNVDAIMSKPDVDGALVGGASLKADKFLRIVNFKKVGAG
jgi:triosephosphate isomerase (TIM)